MRVKVPFDLCACYENNIESGQIKKYYEYL